ncbi:unnamed protein product, partial [Effrenium voratum]
TRPHKVLGQDEVRRHWAGVRYRQQRRARAVLHARDGVRGAGLLPVRATIGQRPASLLRGAGHAMCPRGGQDGRLRPDPYEHERRIHNSLQAQGGRNLPPAGPLRVHRPGLPKPGL